MYSVRLHKRLRFSLLALQLLSQGASGANSFIWGFQTNEDGNVAECTRIPIAIGTSASVTTSIKAPVTMFAYEASGFTTVQTLGSDLNNLFWTVDHTASSQLVLAMVDANGNSGGVAGQVINVQAGTNKSCLQDNLVSPVSLTTNTTKSLESCAILPLKISGGISPYTISVVALGAAAVENVTLSPGFDTFNWVNRASPNTKLLASISDSNGSYAASTSLLITFGSTDLTCNNRFSTQYDSQLSASSVLTSATETLYAVPTSLDLDSKTSGQSNSSNRSIILGATIGGVVFFVVLLAAGFLYYRRRRRAAGFSRISNEELNPFVIPLSEGPYRDSQMAQANSGLKSNGLVSNLPSTSLGTFDATAANTPPRSGGKGQIQHSAGPEGVYQHQDLEDTVGEGLDLSLELPPAYRDRT